MRRYLRRRSREGDRPCRRIEDIHDTPCWIIAGPNGAGKTTFALQYLALPDKGTSYRRVAERVTHGGHNIPAADIERRFGRSLRHRLDDFSHRVDFCRCFMNNAALPELVFEQDASGREIRHPAHYQHLPKESVR